MSWPHLLLGCLAMTLSAVVIAASADYFANALHILLRFLMGTPW
jgi:hypothetical protein